ncbi:MAG: hypothetical protein M3217_08165 [Actinomycetota bacterium]|nr:hypothetical protein [Actinomycetota bacterium]
MLTSMLPIRLSTSSAASQKATGRRRARLLSAAVCAALVAPACSGTPEGRSPIPLSDLLDATSAPATRDGRCDVPRRTPPPNARPRYDMSIEIDPETRTVTGTSDVTFVAGRSTRRLVFRLWPNGPRLASEGARLDVAEATLAGGDATVARPDPTTLVYELGEPLDAGAPVTARLRWRLELPGGLLDRISQNGTSIRLGSFFPILSWEDESGWATNPPTTTLAESSTSPTADFDVTVSAPPALDVIATGTETSPGRWEARAVRDFAVAAGEFETVRAVVDAPRPVDVTVGVARGLEATPQQFADAIATALRDLSRRYGAYPWQTFSMAIMPDLGSAGIEYPTMVFQGEKSLRNATTHEVAHSWFYALVGNNQARDPWLDEGVTSWAQGRSDGTMAFFRDYEVEGAARGRLGAPMRYWDAHEDGYYGGVYVQGVQALDALGDPRLVDCALKRYVAENAYDVATTDDLVDALEPDFPRAARVLRRFGART